MSDNRRVYRRIKQGLMQLYPKQLTGNQARHLNTLTGMMTGIVQSKRCHFEWMATKAPDESQVASRVKRFSRYTQNETIDRETYFMPFIEELVAGLARRGTLVVVMDGSEVGRHCLALVVSLVYKGLPYLWPGRSSKAAKVTFLKPPMSSCWLRSKPSFPRRPMSSFWAMANLMA